MSISRVEIILLAKAIRDTELAAEERGDLVRTISMYMKSYSPLFNDLLLKQIVSTADYKDRYVNYILEPLDAKV